MTFLAWATFANAYEVETHKTMALHAAQTSALNSNSTLQNMGLQGLSPGDVRQRFPDSYTFLGIGTSRQMSITELIQFGAGYEDDRRFVQALYHFFNPVTGQPLTVDGLPPGLPAPAPSPNWALEDTQDFGTDQPFSYKKWRQYFYDALTKLDKTDRDNNWGMTFQTLGHVIHHLQDMGQPQHVRNDPHCDAIPCLLVPGLYSPSLSEQWTLENPPAEALFTAYPPAYSATDPSVFTTPRKFWTTTEGNGTGGKGIAEYTNRGFFSGRTLFSSSAPGNDILLNPPVDVATLCAALANNQPKCPDGISGEMYFFSNTVTDSLRSDTSGTNARAISYSIFDADLKKSSAGPVFALNRFNLDAANSFLIPRAVAYSAGLINHFFRGKLEISLPDEGVYAAIDHNDPASSNKVTGGFPKLKLKLQNMTQGVDPSGNATIEPMENTGGKLVAVAKFHKNNCYTDTLSGEYGAQNDDGSFVNNWKGCRAQDEDIVVSEEEPVPSGIDSAPQPITFRFTNKRIPISATDLYLQVVYRGPLGQETEAVVVATKDISEPVYFHYYQNSDQLTWAHYPIVGTGGNTWAQWCAEGFSDIESCNQSAFPSVSASQFSATGNSIPGFDPNSTTVPPGRWLDYSLLPGTFSPVVSLLAPVGSFARAALLMDLGSGNSVVGIYDWNGKYSHIFQWNPSVTTGGVVVQRDPSNDTLNPSVRYRKARGVWVPAEVVDFLKTGDATDVPNLKPAISTIKF